MNFQRVLTCLIIVFNLSAYLPDALVPQYESLRDQIVSWLALFGFAQSKSDSAAGEALHIQILLACLTNCSVDTSKASKALNDAEHSLSLTRKEKADKDQELARLFDPAWYGQEGEWKKLAGTCIEKEVGE